MTPWTPAGKGGEGHQASARRRGPAEMANKKDTIKRKPTRKRRKGLRQQKKNKHQKKRKGRKGQQSTTPYSNINTTQSEGRIVMPGSKTQKHCGRCWTAWQQQSKGPRNKHTQRAKQATTTN
eukprot:4196338-Prorocentrum_lima.AAC.1